MKSSFCFFSHLIFFLLLGNYSNNKKELANPDPRVQNQSLFCIFVTRRENHIQKDKSFCSWKKHTRVIDGMVGGLKQSLWRGWGHNILPRCRWVIFFFFKEVSRQWSERFVWSFSSAFPSLIWDQQGCSLKNWFLRLLMSCRWLSEPSCDHSSISMTYFANTQVEVLKSFWLIYVCKIWQVHSRSLFRVKGWPCLL